MENYKGINKLTNAYIFLNIIFGVFNSELNYLFLPTLFMSWNLLYWYYI